MEKRIEEKRVLTVDELNDKLGTLLREKSLGLAEDCGNLKDAISLLEEITEKLDALKAILKKARAKKNRELKETTQSYENSKAMR